MDTEQKEAIAQTAMQLLDGVTTVADTKGISPKELESIYSIGCGYYRTGKLEEAMKIFFFLCVMEHTSAKYWTALGVVRQAKKMYDDAIKAYAAAAMLDIHQPKPHFYSAECYFLKGDLDLAESGASALLEFCPAGTPRNNDFRARAGKLLKLIADLREKKEK